jgi:hypothetical protein
MGNRASTGSVSSREIKPTGPSATTTVDGVCDLVNQVVYAVECHDGSTWTHLSLSRGPLGEETPL